MIDERRARFAEPHRDDAREHNVVRSTTLISITRQSNATTASVSAGEPVDSSLQEPLLKRSAIVHCVRPANTSAIGPRLPATY